MSLVWKNPKNIFGKIQFRFEKLFIKDGVSE